jgi:hypothetical protein
VASADFWWYTYYGFLWWSRGTGWTDGEPTTDWLFSMRGTPLVRRVGNELYGHLSFAFFALAHALVLLLYPPDAFPLAGRPVPGFDRSVAMTWAVIAPTRAN